MSGKPQKSSKKLVATCLVSLVVILLVIGLFSVSSNGSRTDSIGPTTRVKKGPLTITVSEGGTLEAHNQVIIKDKVRGSRTIIYLIDEGTHVKKGDLLVQLDASDLTDGLVDQEIDVENAQAALVKASQELEITKSQNKSDIADAKQTYEFAQVDLHKYLDGEYPQDLKQAKSDITLAQEKLKIAETKLNWSKKLHAKQYISDSELRSDQLSFDQAKMSIELKKGALSLLTKYTYKRKVAQLKSDIRQSKMALDRTQRQAQANLVQAQASLRAKKAEYNRQNHKLEDLKTRIKNCKIYAPREGMVIYATTGSRHRGNQEPLAEGQQVHQRQELINLPMPGSMVADIKVHESNINKVKVGQPVQITVDAYPGKTYIGKVIKIAPLPDATRSWLNPNLKVYDTQIKLQGDVSGLRTGMSCRATIIIDHYDAALSVPVQSVVRVGKKTTVFAVDDGEIIPHTVELGLDNNVVVRIVKGISAGEKILLAPPLRAGTVKESGRYAKVLKDNKGASATANAQNSASKDQSENKQKSNNKQKKLEKILEDAKKQGYKPPTAKEVQKGEQALENSDSKSKAKPQGKKDVSKWIKEHPKQAAKWAKEHPQAASKWKQSQKSDQHSAADQ